MSYFGFVFKNGDRGIWMDGLRSTLECLVIETQLFLKSQFSE